MIGIFADELIHQIVREPETIVVTLNRGEKGDRGESGNSAAEVAAHNNEVNAHPDLRTAINNKASPYVHTQPTLSTAWAINHNMGRSPSISVVRSDGTRVEGTVVDNGVNACSIVFAIATSGTAYCI